jgi:hypothetical protein
MSKTMGSLNGDEKGIPLKKESITDRDFHNSPPMSGHSCSAKKVKEIMLHQSEEIHNV